MRPPKSNKTGPAAASDTTRLAFPPPAAAIVQTIVKPKPATRHFQILTTEAKPLTPNLRPALLAHDLRELPELQRLQPLIEALHKTTSGALLLVAGRDADLPCRTAPARHLRHHLEDLGALFINRPADATTPAKLQAFLDREYAPNPQSLAAATTPPAPVAVIEGHDLTPYLEAPPDIPGDHFCLSHLPKGRLPND